MLVSTNCDFKRPLHYPGIARILTKLDKVGNSSFSLRHLILNKEDQICAEGLDTVVCYDFEKKCTFPVPDWLREKLSQY